MKGVKIGIIGCGCIAPTHIRAFQCIPDVEVVWACDLQAERAKELSEQFDIRQITTDYHEVINDADLDCVTVCTDHGSHAGIVVDALSAGRHVLCEKALASTRAGLDAIATAQKHHADLICAGVFQHRFDAVSRYLKRLIDKGVFGEILTASLEMRCLRTADYYDRDAWRGTWAGEGGSVLINQAIHYIDILAWIMGGVASVSGAFANITHKGNIETEDTASAALRFKSGVLGSMTATSGSHSAWEASFAMSGTVGYLELCNNNPIRVDFEDNEKSELIITELAAANEEPEMVLGKSYYGCGHRGLIADFVAAVREGREPFVSATDARHAVDIVLGIYESHRTGGWVKVGND